MTPFEIRASVSLASIFALRMLGLFLILPVFAVHAQANLSGGENAALIGLAMGIYGLAQAFFHVPFGMASDRFGRKPVIAVGLIIFAIGSFVAASADDIYITIIGRALQGVGAVSAAVMAFVADTTREENRTKAMAMIGASIGITFALSLVAAPLLYRWIGMEGIFALTGILAMLAVLVILYVVPAVPAIAAKPASFASIFRNHELMRLNYGVFALHMTQMALFVVMPAAIIQHIDLPIAEHWKIYLPVVVASFFLMLPPVFIGEKKGMMKQVFVAAIALLVLVQAGFWLFLSQPGEQGMMLTVLLLAFFIAFNILEASQPSLVSRIAPASAKGAALGVYNTLQSLGLFCGGVAGGWLVQHVGTSSVFILGTGLTIVWLIIASGMKNLPRRSQVPAVLV